jgi:hypothetical protein
MEFQSKKIRDHHLFTNFYMNFKMVHSLIHMVVNNEHLIIYDHIENKFQKLCYIFAHVYKIIISSWGWTYMENMVWNQWIIIAHIFSSLIISKKRYKEKWTIWDFFFLHFGPFNVALTQNESFSIDLLTILFKFKFNFYNIFIFFII